MKTFAAWCPVALILSGALVAGEPSLGQTAGVRAGLAERVPWTTSRISGSPDPPPPYKVEPAFPDLRFQKPVVITNAPGTGRMFVAEQEGKIYSFENERNCDQLELVANLKLAHPELSSIYGLTFHPEFERNRYVYVCYVVGDVQSENLADGTRVSRFEMSRSDPPQLDASSEQLLITWMAGGHNGGCLKFGPDGYLYIATGDAGPASPPDPLRSGQDVSNLLSSILRIDVDHRGGEEPYRVPDDNPLVGVDGARPEIWSYGFRNPWKFSFDHATGDLWVGDVGWELWEMIYRVEKGGNYGWSILEGRQPVHPEEEPGPTPILPPTLDHPHSEAASITGGFVYRGDRLRQLAGAYIYGDFQTGIVWGARLEGEDVVWHEELARTPLQLVGFGEDNQGELYLLDYQQQIYRLVENPAPDSSAHFPRRLSETGLFASASSHQAAAGVVPYSINAENWSDGARSERWLAVPGGDPIEVDSDGNWQFPDGSVIAKTIRMEVNAAPSGPPSYQMTRLETQILHRESGSWRPYTYVWNEEQTDAELVGADGFSRTVQTRNSELEGGTLERTYRFAGRTECLLCHNPWVEKKTTVFGVQSASPLAILTHQLNRDHDYAGTRANQLSTFRQIGLLTGELPDLPQQAPKFADPYDESTDLTARARAYLHVNCAHCHQFNAGGAATIALSHDVKLDEMRMIGVRPSQGTFGISDARIVKPGDPLSSVLFYRIAKLGGGRMPRVGSEEVDVRGVRLIHDWIEQLDAGNARSTPTARMAAAVQALRDDTSEQARDEAIQQLAASTRGALQLMLLIDGREVREPVRTAIVERTKHHPSADVRDLFERFVPPAERTQRLGVVVNQAEILNLEADAKRGEQVFFENSAANCKGCHRIHNRGEALGPELSQIGTKYRRDQLLQHILEPSRFMEPKYVPYLLETTDGQILSGLLESRSDDEVVLRDAKNQQHHVAANEIELLVRQQKSLMPELLLRDLTRDEVADLLAYLASLK